MKEYKISFWNHGKFLNDGNNVFGCSVHGFSNHFEWVNPGENAVTYWNKELHGVALTGDFQTVLNSLRHLQFTPKVCIAVFKEAHGIDLFIRQFTKVMPGIPIIGGGASVAAGRESGELLPQSKHISLLAVAEGNFVLESLNIYEKSGISVEVERLTYRVFKKLRILPNGNWQDALKFYRAQQKIRGIDENNFELMTFCDRNDRNIHCSIQGKAIKSGASLPKDNILYMGVTSYTDVEQKLAEFISSENSLVFGCAGIRSLIKKPLLTGKNSLIGFMFGELLTLNRQPLFGNLMLTKLTIVL